MRKNAVLVALLGGIALGVVASLVLPSLIRPFVPNAFRGEAVQGAVREKRRDGDHLLLTVVTQFGTSLATFTEEIAGIDLLVQPGDSISLDVPAYQPFLTNPEIVRVSKGTEMAMPPVVPVDTLEERDTIPLPADTGVADDSIPVAGVDSLTADTTG